MPWTFSHPVAVMPLRSLFRNRLPLSALVIGSLTPDLPFYLGSFDVSRMAHTVWGLLAICLPEGLALLAIIRWTHRPIAAVLPSPHRQRLLSLPLRERITTPSAFLYTSLAILVGAFTHIAWDSFTHREGFFVSQFAIFRTPLFQAGGGTIRVYDVLQDASSFVGAVIVLIAYWQWSHRTDLGSEPGGRRSHDAWRYRLLAAITAASLVAAAPIAYFASIAAGAGTHVRLLVIRELIWFTTFFLSLLCVSALTLAHRERAKEPPMASDQHRRRHSQDQASHTDGPMASQDTVPVLAQRSINR